MYLDVLSTYFVTVKYLILASRCLIIRFRCLIPYFMDLIFNFKHFQDNIVIRSWNLFSSSTQCV